MKSGGVGDGIGGGVMVYECVDVEVGRGKREGWRREGEYEIF